MGGALPAGSKILTNFECSWTIHTHFLFVEALRFVAPRWLLLKAHHFPHDSAPHGPTAPGRLVSQVSVRPLASSWPQSQWIPWRSGMGISITKSTANHRILHGFDSPVYGNIMGMWEYYGNSVSWTQKKHRTITMFHMRVRLWERARPHRCCTT